MPVPYTFGTATAAIPLSQLDSNFATAVTIGNTAVQLGNTVTTLNNMTLANVTISSGNVTITNVSVTTANVSGTANVSTMVIIGNESVGGNTTVTGNISANNATLTTNLTLSGGTANGVAYLNTSKVITTGSALYFDGVNLGIGVTPSAWSGYKAIDVASNAVLSGSASAALACNGYYGGGSNWTYKNTGTAAYYQQPNSGGHAWFNAPSGTAGTAITFTQAMTLDASGNLGIGTSSPNGRLELSGTGPVILRLNDTATNYWQLESNSYLAFNRGGTERMRIDSSGNLGLGVTPSAWSLIKAFQVPSGVYLGSYTGSSTPNLYLGANNYFNGTNFIYSGTYAATKYEQTQGAHAWYNAASGTAGNTITFTQAMTLFASGALWVGSSSEISGGQGFLGLNGASGSGAGPVMGFAQNGTFLGGIGQQSRVGGSGTNQDIFIQAQATSNNLGLNSVNGYIYFQTGSTERARIDSVGNTYIETGLLWQYAPTPTTKAAAATLTAAELATDIITLTGTTYTVTLPTGTAIDTYYTGVPATNIGYDFHIINTASGTITMAVGASGMTSVGTLTITTGLSAHFRLRRTAANTYVLYRLS